MNKPSTPDAADAVFMDRALELAARGIALTSPNPMVGAVLVREGNKIGEGFHTYEGKRHAEIVALENAVIAYAADLGVAASGSREAPGVYVEGAKLASIGLRIRRGASYHGLALNVSLDLEPFKRINVCGYPGLAVTRLVDWAAGVDVAAAAAGLLPHLLRHLGYHSAISTNLQAVSSR